MKDCVFLVNLLIFQAPLCTIIIKQWLYTHVPPQHFCYFSRRFKTSLLRHLQPAIKAFRRWQFLRLKNSKQKKSSTVFQFLLTLDGDSWTVYLSHPTLSFLLCSFPSSPPQVLQSALDRIRHGRTGSRLANIHRQHQYVSMRPCASSWFYMVIMTMNSISGPSVCTLLCVCSGW